MELKSTKLSLSIIKGRHFSQFAWIDSFSCHRSFYEWKPFWEKRKSSRNLFNWKICPSGLLWYRIFQIVFLNPPAKSGNDRSWKIHLKRKTTKWRVALKFEHMHLYSIYLWHITSSRHALNSICVKWKFSWNRWKARWKKFKEKRRI